MSVAGVCEVFFCVKRCRNNNLQNILFTLGSVCSNRASRFGYKYARKKESQRRAREYHREAVFLRFRRRVSRFIYTRYAMSDKKGLLFEAIRIGDDEAKVKEILVSLLPNTDGDADNGDDDSVVNKERFDVNVKNEDGEMVLCVAADKGHTSVVELLLKADGVDVNKENNNGSTPLLITAREGHASVVKLLLKADGVDVNKENNNGSTPLLITAREGHASVVELLLKADGVDVNKENNNGSTPLLIAAQEGHASVVELLLKAGDVNTILANIDKSVLLSAGLSLPSLQLLFDADKAVFEECSSEAVVSAARKGQLECLRFLFEKGLCIEQSSSEAIVAAAKEGQSECLRFLFEKGVCMEQCASEAVVAAATEGQLECLRFLFEKGVCIERCASEAAVSAAGSGQLECLQFLHSKGCIITAEYYEIAEDNYEGDVMEWLRSIDAPGIPLSRRQYLRNTMRILDDFKEHLPNGAYLELCEQLKGAYVTSGDADSFRE